MITRTSQSSISSQETSKETFLQMPIMRFGTAQVKLLESFARRLLGLFGFENFGHGFHHFGDVSRYFRAF